MKGSAAFACDEFPMPRPTVSKRSSQEAVAPGSLLHTDGLLSYDRLEQHGYRHRITLLKGRKESAPSCCRASIGWCRC